MKYRDPDSYSGGCSVEQLSACPVGAKCPRFSKSDTQSVQSAQKTLNARLHLRVAGHSARPWFGPLGESWREHLLLPPGSLPSSHQ